MTQVITGHLNFFCSHDRLILTAKLKNIFLNYTI